MAENLLAGRRGKAFLAAVTLVLGVLVTRLFFIQVVAGDRLGAEAVSYRTVTENVPPVRGVIYDRNHSPLVDNQPDSSLYADPRDIKDAPGEAALLAPYLGVTAATLGPELAAKSSFVWLKRDLPYAQTDQLKQVIKKLKLAGLFFRPGQERLYLQGDLAAQVLGFTGLDEQGLTGLEKSYNAQLTGRPGVQQLQVDQQGDPLLPTLVQMRPPVEGDSLVLTIDEHIQFFVEQALNGIVQTYHPVTASIIVMNPKTGGILAMGDRPTFNPAQWQAFPQSVWGQDPAVLNAFEPGSLFKIITAAAVLEEGVAGPQTRYSYPGYIVIQGHRINDANNLVDNDQTLAWAFANSYNPVFARLGVDLGANRFYRYIRGFGFGQPTGVDLPGEADGIVYPEQKVIPLRLATMAFGQGISVTPLQMITAACTVANGGFLVQPRLVRALVDSSGKTVQKKPPHTVRQVVSAATATQVLAMMRQAVENGTGTAAAIPGYSAAGKTGTAQVPGPGGYEPGKYVSSFLAFAPASHPAVAVLIVVNQPKGGKYYGADVAAPVFHTLGAKILHYLDVPYDLPLPPAPPATHPTPAPPAPPLPDLTGYPVSFGRRILAQAGLAVRVQGTGGVVTRQEPPAGTPYAGTVTLVTGANPAGAVTVPNLAGRTIKMAGYVLNSLGLHLAVQGTGAATAQNPAAGTRVAPGTTVQVQFSEAPGP